jgi:hypothetical protein
MTQGKRVVWRQSTRSTWARRVLTVVCNRNLTLTNTCMGQKTFQKKGPTKHETTAIGKRFGLHHFIVCTAIRCPHFHSAPPTPSWFTVRTYLMEEMEAGCVSSTICGALDQAQPRARQGRRTQHASTSIYQSVIIDIWSTTNEQPLVRSMTTIYAPGFQISHILSLSHMGRCWMPSCRWPTRSVTGALTSRSDARKWEAGGAGGVVERFATGVAADNKSNRGLERG